ALALLFLTAFTIIAIGGPRRPMAKPAVTTGDSPAEVTNLERIRRGLAPLKVNDHLQRAAEWLARDMSEQAYLDHVDRLGRSLHQRMGVFGYEDWRSIAENIAFGAATPAEAVAAWLKSPGH